VFANPKTCPGHPWATILGIDNHFGSIQSGKTADLVLFDDKFAVRRVWVGGALVLDQLK